MSLLHERLADLQDTLILPEATPGSDPSWFGFPIAVKDDAPFIRRQIVEYLESQKIATRQLFAGNLMRQPAYTDVKHRVVGDLRRCDFVMNNVFWIGVYPGYTDDMIDFMSESIHRFIASADSSGKALV